MLRIWMKTIEKSEIDEIDGQQPNLALIDLIER